MSNVKKFLVLGCVVAIGVIAWAVATMPDTPRVQEGGQQDVVITAPVVTEVSSSTVSE